MNLGSMLPPTDWTSTTRRGLALVLFAGLSATAGLLWAAPASTARPAAAAAKKSAPAAPLQAGIEPAAAGQLRFYVADASASASLTYRINNGPTLTRKLDADGARQTVLLSDLKDGARLQYSFSVTQPGPNNKTITRRTARQTAIVTTPITAADAAALAKVESGARQLANGSVAFFANGAPWADVDYRVNASAPHKVRMRRDGKTNTWQISGVPTGATVQYTFTLGVGGVPRGTATQQLVYGTEDLTPTPAPVVAAAAPVAPPVTYAQTPSYVRTNPTFVAPPVAGGGGGGGGSDNAGGGNASAPNSVDGNNNANGNNGATASSPASINSGGGDGTTTVVDLGANVIVVDPSANTTTLQAQLDALYAQQKTNEFGTQRYAILFKQGSYALNVNVGYYTTVHGLGMTPDEVTINGSVQQKADTSTGLDPARSTWRGAENLAVAPTGGIARWVAAPAAPWRRVHVKGSLDLCGASCANSGSGYVGDSRIDNQMIAGPGQQWLSRNSLWGSWPNMSGNVVFVGNVSPPTAPIWPAALYTTVTRTPVMREKPFLTIDTSGNYNVFVPPLTTNSTGTSWASGTPQGTAIPIANFFIALPGVTAAQLNGALAQGLHLLFTPGVYHLNQTLHVIKADTVILGMGLATLMPDTGLDAMDVDDVDGVKIAGLLFDAGPGNSPVLLKLGSTSLGHAADPSSLHDVYFRVGGTANAAATTSLTINSGNVIGDNVWLWRADHGIADNITGWAANTAANGLIVNGADVSLYGLNVANYQQYPVQWNGVRGHVYGYRGESPTDMPDQASWQDGDQNGYADYTVASSVLTHELWGGSVYCAFAADAPIKQAMAFKTPNNAGVTFKHLSTQCQNTKGEISHIINSTGDSANTAKPLATLTQFP
ncbi:hypothetical protein WG78_11990 [Amantichitinum ursilacus]|uniref:CBM56 domain-containing protein n=2 Tax=Amantichitinum ursilacus TaxID=857265 RepID=A0A0N0GN74_9NEIS|nr:hypothetical protein WG78_11990 [Amantichitinum ursilacus]